MVQYTLHDHAPVSPAQSLPATILVVEDEAVIRMELAAQLADMGLRVLVACNADEAIRLLDADPEIKAIVTDVTMPGSMDGLRLAHHVHNRWPPIEIVATSGRPQTGVGDLPSGAKFFPKPYSPQTVRNVIGPIFADRRARNAA